jgi:hypothetical protein
VDPLDGFQAYIPNEVDLAQWVKLRHHLLTPEEVDRDAGEAPWEVGCNQAISERKRSSSLNYLQVVNLPLVQTFEITESWSSMGRAQGPCTSVVLTFCDGTKLAQQDEHLDDSASSGKSQVAGGAHVPPKQEAEDDNDDDDDDIFGDKELEQEEEDQAKQEEVTELSTRVKAKGRGVYYVPMVSDNKVKRLRATVCSNSTLMTIPLELTAITT